MVSNHSLWLLYIYSLGCFPRISNVSFVFGSRGVPTVRPKLLIIKKIEYYYFVMEICVIYVCN